MIKPALSISIPTKDRSLIVTENIKRLITVSAKFGVYIYISDGSTNNETYKNYLKLKKIYKNIFYHKVPIHSGHDYNIINSIKVSNSDYVWVLGDSITIQVNFIEKILKIIKRYNPSIIGVNDKDRNVKQRTGLYRSYKEVFLKFAWHLTLTGTTIYNKEIISKYIEFDTKRYKNFPQMYLIFNTLIKDSEFYWINNHIISRVNIKKKSYWSSSLFEVFLDDWSNAIYNLSNAYSYKIKKKVIRSHDENTNVFSIRSLALARSEGNFSLKKLFMYYNKMSLGFMKFILLFGVSIFPKNIINIWRNVINVYRN